MQQHAVGVDFDLVADAAVFGDPHELEQFRVEQRFAPDKSEFLHVRRLGKRADVAFVIRQQREFLRHQRRRMVALVAAEVAVLGEVVFDAEQLDLRPDADGRIHWKFLIKRKAGKLYPSDLAA